MRRAFPGIVLIAIAFQPFSSNGAVTEKDVAVALRGLASEVRAFHELRKPWAERLPAKPTADHGDGCFELVFKNAIVKYSNNGPSDYQARIQFSAYPHSPNAPYTSVPFTLKRNVGEVKKALGTHTLKFGPLTKLFKKSKGVRISISILSSEGKDPVGSNNVVTLHKCD